MREISLLELEAELTGHREVISTYAARGAVPGVSLGVSLQRVNLERHTPTLEATQRKGFHSGTTPHRQSGAKKT